MLLSFRVASVFGRLDSFSCEVLRDLDSAAIVRALAYPEFPTPRQGSGSRSSFVPSRWKCAVGPLVAVTVNWLPFAAAI